MVALVPEMAKENSKMSSVFLNEIHSLCTDSNISEHLLKFLSYILFHTSILVLLIFAI
jgi:hypothetical protein